MTKIIIADDHKMFRDGISAIIKQEPDIELVGEAGNALEIFEMLDKNLPDILLLDISLGESDGIEITKILRERYPGLKVIIISMHSESSYVINALEAGAYGYLLKDAGKIEMLNAIRAVAAGASFFGKNVSQIIRTHFSEEQEIVEKQEMVALTKRETEVLKLIAAEHSNQEVADKLFISIRTVDTHRRNLLEKLKLKNNAGLVRYAIKNGLTE